MAETNEFGISGSLYSPKGSWVVARGFDARTERDTIKLFFESKKRSGGGKIQMFDYDEKLKQATIVYFDEQVCKTVMQKAELLLENAKLSVEEINANSSCERFSKCPHSDPETGLIVTWQSNISGNIRHHFENKNRSGGGEIKQLAVDCEKQRGLIFFVDPQDTIDVLKRSSHMTENIVFTVKPYVKQPTDGNKILVSNLQDSIDNNVLMIFELLLEQCSGQRIVEITHSQDTSNVLVVFNGVIDVALISDKWKDNAKSEKCGPDVKFSEVLHFRALLVRCTDSSFERYLDSDVKDFYEHSKRGGHIVEKVEIHAIRKCAVVHYSNHADASDVIFKERHLSGITMRATPFHEDLGIMDPSHDTSKPSIKQPSVDVKLSVEELGTNTVCKMSSICSYTNYEAGLIVSWNSDKVPTGFSHMIQVYFENCSGGGKIKLFDINFERRRVIIFFVDSQVSNNVLKKPSHCVGDITLTIQPYVKRPVEENKILVTNLPDFMDHRDLIIFDMLLRKCSGREIIKKIHAQDTSNVIVVFNGKIDYAKSETCGPDIEFREVSHTSAVLVHCTDGRFDIYSDKDIKDLYELPKRGGHVVEKVDMHARRKCAVVHYQSHTAANDVLHKESSLTDVTLRATPFYEDLGIIDPTHDTSKPSIRRLSTIVLSNTHCGINSFILSKADLQKALEEHMLRHFATVKLPRDPESFNEIYITPTDELYSPTGQCHIKEWPSKVESELHEFYGQFAEMRVSTGSAAVHKGLISRLANELDGKNQYVVNTNACSIRVVGLKEHVQNTVKKIEKMLSYVEEDEHQKKTVRTEKIDLGVEMKYLERTNQLEKVKNMFRKTDIVLLSKQIQITGTHQEIKRIRSELKSMLQKLVKKSKKISKLVSVILTGFFQKGEVDSLLEQDEIKASWEIRFDLNQHSPDEDVLMVVAEDLEVAFKALEKIENMVFNLCSALLTTTATNDNRN